jgi:hypothetical protein
MILGWRFWPVILLSRPFILLSNYSIPLASTETVGYGCTIQTYLPIPRSELIAGPNFTAY